MSEQTVPLRSWKEGKTKQSILDFVSQVTNEEGPDFVKPEARIAVFDNDGTLWCEKPLPVQADFLMRQVAEQAIENPSLCEKQPWKAVSEKDYRWFNDVITKHYQGDDTDLKIMGAGLLQAYAGESTDSFAEKANDYLRTALHPTLKRSYLETAYAPMIELLQFLNTNGFTNYIASGGTRDFMRPITEELYGIPPERVIGSTVALEYRFSNGVGGVYHKPELELFDDGPAKPVRIWSRIGRRPILVGGNSNGDLQMLEFASHPSRPSLSLLVHHDDDQREIAYTAGAEKVLELARARSWTIASIQNDWSTVFAESEQQKSASGRV